MFARLLFGLPRLASASGISFSRRTSTSWCWWLRGWCGFWCRFCTIVVLMPDTALVSSRTLPFCFRRVTNTSASCNATYSMESTHHNCNSYAKVPSSIQRTAAIQQSHSILNGGCRLFDNSMANFTNLCQIPGSESTSAARTSASSSCEVFMFHGSREVAKFPTTAYWVIVS